MRSVKRARTKRDLHETPENGTENPRPIRTLGAKQAYQLAMQREIQHLIDVGCLERVHPPYFNSSPVIVTTDASTVQSGAVTTIMSSRSANVTFTRRILRNAYPRYINDGFRTMSTLVNIQLPLYRTLRWTTDSMPVGRILCSMRTLSTKKLRALIGRIAYLKQHGLAPTACHHYTQPRQNQLADELSRMICRTAPMGLSQCPNEFHTHTSHNTWAYVDDSRSFFEQLFNDPQACECLLKYMLLLLSARQHVASNSMLLVDDSIS